MVFDYKTRRCVFPIYTYHDDLDGKLKQLAQLGIETKPVKMSFKLFYVEFYEGTIPDWLVWDQDCEAGIFDFMDSKDRMRLRVAGGGVCLNTYVSTRYYPSDILAKKILPAVRDACEEDENDCDKHKIIWSLQKAPKGCIMPYDFRAVGEKWLDENYPDWRNPMAYWPE